MNLKLVLGGSFIVGGIFWAGATYNRMGNMETSLSEIKTSIAAVAVAVNEVPLLKLRISTLEGEVERLKADRDEQERRR